MDQVAVHRTTVTVIGAGQAGLSAGYHLQNAGFVDAQQEPEAPKTFIMVDANQQPGGAWSHRWDSLTMGTVNGIFGLPGHPVPKTDPSEKSNQALPAYFSDYEEELGLPIIRPVHVQSVVRADNDPHGKLVITTNVGQWVSDYVINATGTWNNPLWPEYPGTETFQGTQLHTQDYVSGELFTGQRVAVVGAGISAIQHLDEISRHTTVLWYTRREPEFISGPFRSEVEGRATIDKVTADAEAGKPTRSIVSYTGLGWNGNAVAAKERGALNRRPMFTAVEPYGVREADGSFTSVDTLLWATGFRADISHLDPLDLRNSMGGIQIKGTKVVAEPRVYLIGFGPSQSTVGANRAGRAAVRDITRRMSAESAPQFA